jgi:hypothetical protein
MADTDFNLDTLDAPSSKKNTAVYYIVLLGIAITGLAALVNTYEAIAGINSDINTVVGDKLNTEFIILLIISLLAFCVGIILFIVLKKKNIKISLFPMALIAFGIIGFVYSLSIKFQYATYFAKLTVSWVAFIIFLLIGIYMTKKEYESE